MNAGGTWTCEEMSGGTPLPLWGLWGEGGHREGRHLAGPPFWELVSELEDLLVVSNFLVPKIKKSSQLFVIVDFRRNGFLS